jgi:hypothetical protein
MAIPGNADLDFSRGARSTFPGLLGVFVTALVALLVTAPGVEAAGAKHCSATAAALFAACGFEALDDAATARAKCINVEDTAERKECLAEAKTAFKESKGSCRETRRWRLDACKVLGQGRYDPDFDPALFDDPKNPTSPNPYFPLEVGNLWEYRGAGEVNTVEVLDRTKLIDGVTCLVVSDQVFKDGDLVEDTDDWFAAAKDGNVWYCGEEVKDFESFDGDDPRLPELVSIDGSFKAGRDRDKPGIIFQATPTVGQSYLEEFSLGNAEDVTDVLSTTFPLGADPELVDPAPAALVQLLCANDCVVTRNYSLLEPGIFAWKYYARDIGFFLEVQPESGEVIQLTSCNHDPRCASLPQP